MEQIIGNECVVAIIATFKTSSMFVSRQPTALASAQLVDRLVDYDLCGDFSEEVNRFFFVRFGLSWSFWPSTNLWLNFFSFHPKLVLVVLGPPKKNHRPSLSSRFRVYFFIHFSFIKTADVSPGNFIPRKTKHISSLSEGFIRFSFFFFWRMN